MRRRQLVQALFGLWIYLVGWPARELQHRPRPCLMHKTGAAEFMCQVYCRATVERQASSPSAASTSRRASAHQQTHHEGVK